MSKIVLIGDVHGHTKQYQKMIRRRFADKRTIQLGDMGIGFKGVGLHEMPSQHRWFRGNHDDPEKCHQNVNYMGADDFGYLPQDNLFWLAGAFSMDKAWRVSGVSWWSGEELSYNQLQAAIDLYTKVKPKFVISHEAPSEAAKNMLLRLASTGLDGGYFAAKLDCTMSRTAEALQVMFDAHQPKFWAFGHYHVDREFQWRGTTFRCIAELNTYELDTDE